MALKKSLSGVSVSFLEHFNPSSFCVLKSVSTPIIKTNYVYPAALLWLVRIRIENKNGIRLFQLRIESVITFFFTPPTHHHPLPIFPIKHAKL